MSDTAPPADPTTPIAAIDLGSNSFHLVIARPAQQELQTLDRLGEKVQLAAGLDDNRQLDQAAMERGWECLRLFAQRLQGIPECQIRVVGTNTLRTARNRRAFITEAEQILDCPIEVIAGREEARLIYLGVAHSLAHDGHRRLVMDIGGGSTEFVIGEGFTPHALESLHMGCVTYSERYFKQGKLTSKRFQKAVDAARLELLNICKPYKARGWDEAVGASGSIKAIRNLLLQNGWSSDEITYPGLIKLRDRVLEFDHLDAVKLDGLKASRAAVLPAGLAILIAAFESLAIERMRFADGALREGLLYDQIGRQEQENVRERTLNALIERYHVDTEQAQAVKQTALTLFEQLLDSDLNTLGARQTRKARAWLGWAARLHEIGLAIAHSQFQKHGAYLVQHSDLMGFSLGEQQALAQLVRSHRRKLAIDELNELPPKTREILLFLLLPLRLAVLLHRSRDATAVPALNLRGQKRSLELQFPAGWLAEHPLTETDLAQEASYLQAIELNLAFS